MGGTMRLELTSPDRIHGVVLISADTGRAVVESGEGDDLATICELATSLVHGGIEPWVPPLEMILDWCVRRGIDVRVVDQPERAPVDPDLTY